MGDPGSTSDFTQKLDIQLDVRITGEKGAHYKTNSTKNLTIFPSRF